MKYIKNIGTAVSQFLNACIGGNPNMTISARSYCEGWVFAEKAINYIFFFDEDHCRKSWQRDVEFCAMVGSKGR
jgi:hypothetical protein